MKQFFLTFFVLFPFFVFAGTEAFVLKSNSYGNGIRCPYHNECNYNGSWNRCPTDPCKDLQNFRNSFVYLANKHDLDPNLVLGYAQRLSLGGEETSRYEFLKHLSKEDLQLIREHFNEYEKKYGKIDRKAFLKNVKRNNRKTRNKIIIVTAVGWTIVIISSFRELILTLLCCAYRKIRKLLKNRHNHYNKIEDRYNRLTKEAC